MLFPTLARTAAESWEYKPSASRYFRCRRGGLDERAGFYPHRAVEREPADNPVAVTDSGNLHLPLPSGSRGLRLYPVERAPGRAARAGRRPVRGRLVLSDFRRSVIVPILPFYSSTPVVFSSSRSFVLPGVGVAAPVSGAAADYEGTNFFV